MTTLVCGLLQQQSHTMPVTFYRYFKCHIPSSILNRGFSDLKHCEETKPLMFIHDITCLCTSSRRKTGDSAALFQETSSVFVIFLMFSNVAGFFMQSQATATIRVDYAMS